MRLKVTDIVIVALVGVLGFTLYNRFKTDDVQPINDADIAQTSVEKDLEEVLGITIPDEGEKLELSNGDSKAIVIKDENTLNIIADLPDGEYEVVGVGKLVEGKGGYVLSIEVSSDIKDIKIKQGEETVLQGSF